MIFSNQKIGRPAPERESGCAAGCAAGCARVGLSKQEGEHFFAKPGIAVVTCLSRQPTSQVMSFVKILRHPKQSLIRILPSFQRSEIHRSGFGNLCHETTVIIVCLRLVVGHNLSEMRRRRDISIFCARDLNDAVFRRVVQRAALSFISTPALWRNRSAAGLQSRSSIHPFSDFLCVFGEVQPAAQRLFSSEI
jgi:hypothetical protein